MGFETIKQWLKIEQAQEQPTKTTEELSHELQETIRVRNMLGPNLKKIKIGGGVGHNTQKRLAGADREIARLRAELDARSDKAIK